MKKKNSSTTRRKRVVQAVIRPVRSGGQHCINVLKEVLPREAIHEIQQQVASGVQPLQAVEAVAQQRMGPKAAADLTKLFVAVSLASSAGRGVVAAGKSLACVVARPLLLRGPMRVLTNVLLPTPVAGSLLGCCLVVHTARELLRTNSNNDNNDSQQSSDSSRLSSSSSSKANKAGVAAAAGVHSAADAEAAAAAAGGSQGKLAQQQQQQQSSSSSWWSFWGSSTEGAAVAAAADAGAAVSSPLGPVTPAGVGGVFSSNSAGGVAAAANSPADGAASAAAFVPCLASVGQAAAHPLAGVSLFDLDSCGSEDGGHDDPAAGASAAEYHCGPEDPSKGRQHAAAPGAEGPSAFPLRPLGSLRAVVGTAGATTDTAGADAHAHALNDEDQAAAAAATEGPAMPASPVSHQVLCRQRSTSYTGEGGLASFSSGSYGSLSPGSSAPHSPRDQIEGQAAEMHRRWTNGSHNDMMPERKSLQMMQQQAYRPPVFTRLSSGRGGCRITAAAAAAAAREQHAARMKQRQQERAAARGGAGGDGSAAATDAAGGGVASGEDFRRYHSLDINRAGHLLTDLQEVEGLARTISAAATAAAAGGGGAVGTGRPAAAAAAAGAGTSTTNTNTAHLGWNELPPPLQQQLKHGQEGGEEQQQQQQGRPAVDELQELRRVGMVKHRSLDWGHKLMMCNADAA